VSRSSSSSPLYHRNVLRVLSPIRGQPIIDPLLCVWRIGDYGPISDRKWRCGMTLPPACAVAETIPDLFMRGR
jgi:hypothetical protein